VFVHGVWMDSTQWAPVAERLARSFRCVSPTLPLGTHRRAMAPDADLSLRGHAVLVTEFLERLGVDGVTLIFNEWCAARRSVLVLRVLNRYTGS
jgi:pimeloyl-ACP methyl ester carboxylesterase